VTHARTADAREALRGKILDAIRAGATNAYKIAQAIKEPDEVPIGVVDVVKTQLRKMEKDGLIATDRETRGKGKQHVWRVL
jgi:DNA-binding PadR family transcriptional regulator